MKKNNKGFSYVELILVMAIMAILVAMVSISMGVVSRSNVNRGAERLNASLSKARNAAMAKGTDRGTIEITCDGSKYYCFVGSSTSTNKIAERQEIGASPMVVGYYLKGNSEMITIQAGTPLILKYNQSTGAFKELSGGGYCDKIVFTNGSSTAEIKLYSATGKTELIY